MPLSGPYPHFLIPEGMTAAQVGLIGLAVMGANMARNISNHGFTTVVYNRSTEKMKAFIQAFGNAQLAGQETLEEFVQALEKPRKIILMVKAGDPVDEVIDQLMPLLDAGDMIIDCGNSNFRDTIRRNTALMRRGIQFVGCGVSGGEEGALHGPSLMPGGSLESWNEMKTIWEAIAAQDFDGGPCVTHIGGGGAGHYVKMVHNGIEYAVMQMIAEAYDLLQRVYGQTPDQVAAVFQRYHEGRLSSFLFEISVPVLTRKDDDGDGFLVDKILDKADQKGTGKWTAMEALDRGVALSSISEAVFARVNSSFKGDRMNLAPAFPKPDIQPRLSLQPFLENLESSLYGGMLSAYVQGFELIHSAARDEGWKVNLAEISRIWQGGCIIRAELLRFLAAAYQGFGQQASHLLELQEIQEVINAVMPPWREVVCLSVEAAVPTPVLTAGLQYLDATTTERLPANLIQGLRDFFGAHTYERIDKEGVFHTEWNSSSS